MRLEIETKYKEMMQAEVKVDGHNFVYICTGIMFKCAFPQVEVSWINSDLEPKSEWVEGWRVELA
jgi:hypothetical protein